MEKPQLMDRALIVKALEEVVHNLATSRSSEPGPYLCPWVGAAYGHAEELLERLKLEVEE